MTRVRLNWVTLISVVACVVACGSSGNKTLGDSSTANVGGGAASSTVGGNGANNAGGNGNGGNGSSGNGTSGNGTAGSSSQAGNGSGTGSTGSTTDGGSGGNVGGTGNVGGDGSVGGDYYANIGGDGAGGGSSVDVKITGGTGSSTDFTTGGSGSSTDFATGGGFTIDTATGGGATIDTATGGGGTIDTATGGGGTIDTATGGGSTIDHATGGGSTIDQGTGGGGTIDFGCKKTDLTNINVYVIKDATPSGADTEGNMYVGGNLVPTTAGYSVGAKDVVDCTTYSLVVGGNVSNVVVKGGKAAAGGTITSSTNQDCGGITRGVPSSVNFANLEAQVEGLSIGLSKLPVTNCTVSTNGSGALVLTATDPVLSICSIDGSQLGNVNVNFPAGSSVVVNVTGTNITWGGSVCLNGHCDDSTQADYVVWNMYQATNIAPSGIAIEGSLLAPLATLAGGGGHVAGQVIVKYLTGGLEYHPYYFSGCIKWPASI